MHFSRDLLLLSGLEPTTFGSRVRFSEHPGHTSTPRCETVLESTVGGGDTGDSLFVVQLFTVKQEVQPGHMVLDDQLDDKNVALWLKY